MLRISYVLLTLPILLFLITNVSECSAQRDSTSKYKAVFDTVRTDTLTIIESELPKHSPTRATLFSTFVPGLGQAYNRKYWKIPVIYAGMGIFFYYASEQNKLFDDKRDAYSNRVNGDSSDVYLEDGNFFSNEALLTSMDVNRRNRDLMVILGAGVYIMQIIDATVDAHMFYFNVSDDLSLNYRPFFNYDIRSGRSSSGITLNLQF